MSNETQLTTLNIDKKLHRRARLYCAKHETDLTKLITGLLADFMKGKRVR